MIDYYNLLGIEADAPLAAIRAAFRTQAKRHHPDAHPHLRGAEKESAQRRFILLAQAYQTLIDPERRRDYDRKWRAHRASRRPPSASRPPPRPSPPRGKGAARNAAAAAEEAPQAKAGSGGEGENLDDLLHDVEELLSGFGIDLKQPMERIFEELLDWARRIFEQVFEAWVAAERQRRRKPRPFAASGQTGEPPPPPPGGRRRPPSRPPPSSRASGEAVERELAEIKLRVRAGMRDRRPPPEGPDSAEAELRRMRARKTKGD